ncbi:MAG: hypothetical protein HWD85_07445 [Flavobacteriaceae bacterium]|nr:hypothetical protein [Flavobacteriaceae bacterium]
MSFNQNKFHIINELKQASDFKKDLALQRVVKVIEKTNNSKELKKERSLINRISIDGVLEWKNINKILQFIENNI